MRAATGLEAHVHAVAVEVLAFAREPDERVEELLVVLHAGRELVLDDDVAGRQEHVGRATRREVGLRQQIDRAVGHLCEVAAEGRQLARDAAELVAAHQRPCLVDPRERRLDRGRRLADAREDLARERARGRERLVERCERPVGALQRARQLADRGLQVAGLGRERGHRRVEVGDQALKCVLVADQRSAGARGAVDQPREVTAGLDSQERLQYHRGRALGLRDVVVGVVEGLRGRLTAGGRVGVAVLGRRRLGGERHGEAVEHVLEVVPCIGLQCSQDLVELHRRRRLGDLERVAVLEDRRRGRAALEIHEEVALEEDPRADLGRRVGVQRQPLVVDRQHDHRGVRALVGLHGRDLADLHAGDPDRRPGPDRVRRLERRPHLERRREREVLREPEEHDRHGHGERDQADEDGAARLAATHQGVFSVVACWRPAELPMIVWPATYGSLPASHSFG